MTASSSVHPPTWACLRHLKDLHGFDGPALEKPRPQGKLASAFTVSSLPAGDKHHLLSMFVFAMQHGMVWVGNAILPSSTARAV